MGVLKDKKKREQAAEIVFYLLVFAAITCFAMIQTYGDPPDEINRFKVVNYICNHGSLPHGADPEVILAGYGASYAFQPILTYIIQGFLLRFLRLFTADGYVLLLAARMVNVVFGVVMAWFVRRIAKEVWENPYIQWVFTLLVVFLPQNLFIHSYVNTDSMAMLSVSIIFYTLLRAQRTNYNRNDCILLSVGIILCAMSYYNAYGIILAAILIFIINFIHYDVKPEVNVVNGSNTSSSQGTVLNAGGENGNTGKKQLWVDWSPLLKKGIFISVIVLAGIGWWFIRNAVLYQGDLIAMNARRECAIETATADYNPLTRFTYRNAGIPLRDMLFTTGYITLLRDSFIAMFGPMIIPTHGLIYIYYKKLWIVTCIAALLPVNTINRHFFHRIKDVRAEDEQLKKEYNINKKNLIAFYGGMVLFCAITIALSIYYSYTWEFQPQGRYILPVLIPFMYLVTWGVAKIYTLLGLLQLPLKKGSVNRTLCVGSILGKVMCLGIMVYIMLAFLYSMFNRFIPYYLQGENMFAMYGKTFVP